MVKKYKKHTPEERRILNFCRTTEIYKLTNEMLDLPISDIQFIRDSNKRKLSEGWRYKNLTEKQVYDLRLKYMTVTKQANRIISLRTSELNQLRQDYPKEEYSIFEEIQSLKHKINKSKREEKKLKELILLHKQLCKEKSKDEDDFLFEEDKYTYEEDEEEEDLGDYEE
jgi:hypothetical protein